MAKKLPVKAKKENKKEKPLIKDGKENECLDYNDEKVLALTKKNTELRNIIFAQDRQITELKAGISPTLILGSMKFQEVDNIFLNARKKSLVSLFNMFYDELVICLRDCDATVNTENDKEDGLFFFNWSTDIQFREIEINFIGYSKAIEDSDVPYNQLVKELSDKDDRVFSVLEKLTKKYGLDYEVSFKRISHPNLSIKLSVQKKSDEYDIFKDNDMSGIIASEHTDSDEWLKLDNETDDIDDDQKNDLVENHSKESHKIRNANLLTLFRFFIAGCFMMAMFFLGESAGRKTSKSSSDFPKYTPQHDVYPELDYKQDIDDIKYVYELEQEVE